MTPTELRAIRASLGYTAAELAKEIGVDRITVWRWETGRRDVSKTTEKLLMLLTHLKRTKRP